MMLTIKIMKSKNLNITNAVKGFRYLIPISLHFHAKDTNDVHVESVKCNSKHDVQLSPTTLCNMDLCLFMSEAFVSF